MAKQAPPVEYLLQEHARIGRVEIWQRVPNEIFPTLLSALERRDELIAAKSACPTWREQLRRLRGWTTKIRVVDEFGDQYDYPNSKVKK